MLRTIGIRDPERLIPALKDGQPKDPVSENMAVLMGKPVKVYAYQDHESHIAVHQAAMQDPKIMQLLGQNPQAQMLMAAGHAHLAEHVAFAYRQRMEQAMGAALPDPEDDTQIPKEMEYQLASVLAQAASKVLQQSQSEAAIQQAQQAAQDPVLMMQKQELELKKQELQQDAQFKQAELQLAQKTQQDTVDLRKLEIAAKGQMADDANRNKAVISGAQLAVQTEHKAQDRHHKAVLTGAQMAADSHHKAADRQLQTEQMQNQPTKGTE